MSTIKQQDSTVDEEMAELLSNEEKENNEGVILEEEKITLSPIITQILNVSDELKILDEYFEELPSLQSKIDEELSDLLHYIENNSLTPKQSTKMVKLLQEKRLIRRSLCNDYEIKKVYNSHKNKMTMDGQRQFFLNEIYKKAKELNRKYRNRRLEDEEIKGLLK